MSKAGNEIEKAYEAKKYEDKVYKNWEKSGLFRAEVNPKKKPFTIAMPPPNATGQLHLGHAVMLALEDIMIRYHRMRGDSALWLPGTDHAAIATQNKVEQVIAKEGTDRHKLGRAKFLQRVKEYVADSQDTIRNQIRKMGASCDWSREGYTMSEDLSHAVHTVFVRMFKDGLIYRGNRIVNWCYRCSSTLADDEVEYKEETTPFYYFKFGPFTIGTVRPETKLADKVVIVHPKDKRYKKWHHKKMMIPWIDEDVEMQVIPDEAADMEMGSGAMTITPAHSFVDFELAQKYDIPVFNIIGEDGKLTEKAGHFEGMNVREARKKFVEILKKKGLVEKIDANYVHNVSVCYRCDTPIEPLVSKQWFVDVNKKVIKRRGKRMSLKEASLDVVKRGEIEIIPDRFNKIYFHWMENLHDWCISRQIWWGHRIPVWYSSKSKQIKVQAQKPKETEKTGKWKQDPDTLDTWFSSALWTFSTLGWPKKTKELEYFHPTSVLETGHDIIFFWVARMILMSLYALNDIPFKTVYLHGLVTDKHGQKMSKSKGNGIDPLDMIAKYGADAVRLSLVIGSTPGNSMSLYEEKIAGYRNFVNKIWNASRFAIMNLDKGKSRAFSKKDITTKADKWILSRLQKLIKEVSNDIEKFRFSDAGSKIYEFTWGQYCDWYLEMSKGENISQGVLKHVLETLLTLIHPFTPFVSEIIWQNLDKTNQLIAEPWPKFSKSLIFPKEEEDIELIKDLISKIRSARKEAKVDPVKKIKAIVFSKSHKKLIKENTGVIMQMARLEELEIYGEGKKPKNALSIFLKDIHVYLPLEGMINLEDEIRRLAKELEKKRNFLKAMEAKLNNDNFLEKAPSSLVEKEKEKYENIKQEVEQLESKLKELK